MGELIHSTVKDGPMCPNGLLRPGHPAHELRVRILDALYDAADKDADGEMSDSLQHAYTEAAYGNRTADSMRLYHDSTTVITAGRTVLVEAWYYQCGLCGLILPATARPSP